MGIVERAACVGGRVTAVTIPGLFRAPVNGVMSTMKRSVARTLNVRPGRTTRNTSFLPEEIGCQPMNTCS